MSPNLRSLVPPAVYLCNAEKVNGWSLHAWFPLWSMEEEVWWCGAALLVTLLGIYSKLKAHWTSMATTASCSDMPSHSVCIGPSFTFQQDNDPKHTSRLCKGYLTKKESDGVLRQMTCHPKPNQDGLMNCRVKAKGPTSTQHLWELLQDCWKTISGDYLMKLIERMPRVCKAVIKEKGSYFKEFELSFELLNIFLLTT